MSGVELKSVSLQNCSSKNILLENIIKNRGNDPILLMISNVTSGEDGEDGNKISILQIVNKMVISYNIDVFRWYHDSV